MDIELTDAHEEFRASVRGLLAERSPMARVRALIESDTGYDAETWSLMADQLGLQGLIVPEQYGGSGFGFVELAVALEETGRALVSAPLLATVFATLAIIHSGDEQAAKQQLPAIAAGDTIAALALADDSAQWPPHPDSLLAHPNGDGYVLKGHRWPTSSTACRPRSSSRPQRPTLNPRSISSKPGMCRGQRCR